MDEPVKAIKAPDDEQTPEGTVEKAMEPDTLRIISQSCSMEYIKRLRESADTDLFSTAYRVGSSIRFIRKAKGLSQAELGEKVGLTADRVQKYENGIRKPKPELIQEFATALGVNRKALEDPVISDPIGALFALFEMEMLYNLKVERSPDNNAILTFGHGVSPELDAFLAEWENAYKHFNVMDLYTQTVSELDAPFKVIAKESKSLVQEYLEKNKEHRPIRLIHIVANTGNRQCFEVPLL